MQKFKSHKVVEAGRVLRLSPTYGINDDLQGARITVQGADNLLEVDLPWLQKQLGARVEPPFSELVGGFIVVYSPDGYISWSPAKAFEEGYTLHDPDQVAGLPAPGYKPTQSREALDSVSAVKHAEERVLRLLDGLRAKTDGDPLTEADQRWLAIGRTQLEQGFSAVCRAIFKPGRCRLPEDDVEPMLFADADETTAPPEV